MHARPHEPLDTRTSVALAALAVGLVALGALGVGSGDFAFQWQPVQPDVPARGTLAVAAGLLEIAAAGLLAFPRQRAIGAWLAAALLLAWAALHVPAVVQRPASIADWLGVAESAAMASAALMFAAGGGATRRACTLVFGLAAIVFGASHFAYADFTASMIPSWLPQRVGLAYFTGAAHALAGIAIVTGVLRVLAASLEALMMAVFVVLVHLPRVLAHPGSRMEWTMLAVAVTLSGSAAMVAAVSKRHAGGHVISVNRP